MLVEIIAQNGLTHEGRILHRGDVVEADARLMELAQPGHLHLGEQVCRPYDPERSAAEAEEELRVLQRSSLPSREVLMEAADHYGVVLVTQADYEAVGKRLQELEAALASTQQALTDVSEDNVQLRARVAELEADLASEQAEASAESEEPEQPKRRKR